MFLFACASVLALDQWSKALVVGALAEGGYAPRWTLAPVRVRRLSNRRPSGAALLAGPVPLAATLLLTAGVLAALALVAFPADALARAALGAALGGAMGNALDRLRRGTIVDFIDLRVWPLFNLADAAIVCGASIALWRLV